MLKKISKIAFAVILGATIASCGYQKKIDSLNEEIDAEQARQDSLNAALDLEAGQSKYKSMNTFTIKIKGDADGSTFDETIVLDRTVYSEYQYGAHDVSGNDKYFSAYAESGDADLIKNYGNLMIADANSTKYIVDGYFEVYVIKDKKVFYFEIDNGTLETDGNPTITRLENGYNVVGKATAKDDDDNITFEISYDINTADYVEFDD